VKLEKEAVRLAAGGRIGESPGVVEACSSAARSVVMPPREPVSIARCPPRSGARPRVQDRREESADAQSRRPLRPCNDVNMLLNNAAVATIGQELAEPRRSRRFREKMGRRLLRHTDRDQNARHPSAEATKGRARQNIVPSRARSMPVSGAYNGAKAQGGRLDTIVRADIGKGSASRVHAACFPGQWTPT